MTLKTGSPDRVKRPTECVDEAPDESSAGVSVDKVTLCVAHLDVPNVLIHLLNAFSSDCSHVLCCNKD